MNIRFTIVLSAVASLAFVNFVSALPEKRGSETSEQFFRTFDADRSSTIDEGELLLALQSRQGKRAERLARLELAGSPKADQLVDRIEVESQDVLIGTPESASSFIIANFDEDGDSALNQVELSQAFSSIRKWRSETR